MSDVLISQEEIANLREYALGVLNGTAVKVVDVPVDDQMGGETTTQDQVATYACRLEELPRSSQETLQAQQERALERFTLKLPWDAVIDERDRLMVGDNVYEVLGTNSDRADRLLLTCDVTRVR